MAQEDILTIGRVAELLHLHVMTVYRLAREGRLPGFKVGSRWRFRRDVLESWMADRAQAALLEAESRRLGLTGGESLVKGGAHGR